MFCGGIGVSPHRRRVSWPNQREHRIEEVKVGLETPPIEPLPRGLALTPNSTRSVEHLAGDEQNAKLVDYKARLRFGAGRFAS